MSVLIKACADRLAIKFDTIATAQGKLDAKMYYNIFIDLSVIFSIIEVTMQLTIII